MYFGGSSFAAAPFGATGGKVLELQLLVTELI